MPPSWKKFKGSLLEILFQALEDLLYALLFWLTMKAIDWVLERMYGPHIMYFGRSSATGIPLEWFFQAQNVALIAGFSVLQLLRMFGIIKKKD
jgi:hypothetical protein